MPQLPNQDTPIQSEDALSPVLRPFEEINNSHRIGRFDSSENMVWEKLVRLSDDKTKIWVMIPTSIPGVYQKHAIYDIQQYVGIRFEKDSKGYYWLRFQSSRHPDLNDFKITSQPEICLEIIPGTPKSLNFIGADDIRTYSCMPYIEAGLRGESDKIFTQMLGSVKKSVQPGGVANLKYVSLTEIHFECNC